MYSEKKCPIIKSHSRFYPLFCCRFFTSVLLSLFFIPTNALAGDTIPDYDEVLVIINVQQMGNYEIPALISEEDIYLPIIDVFKILKIKFIPTDGLDSISGFFINQKNNYLIDRINHRILYGDKNYELDAVDLIRTETNLYLKLNYFGQIFGLESTFNFRSLSVSLKSKLELPAIREMRLEQMRLNINRLKGDFKADSTIGKTHTLFHFGTADWSLTSTQETEGTINTRLNLTLGAVLAGGELKSAINYGFGQPFSLKNQYYLWRSVNNDRKVMRQAMVGNISAQPISTILYPVLGVQVTNSSTILRKSFGTYTVSDFTEPGWTVELYVNNVLIDYAKADASGFFTFDVPLVYGNTEITRRYYGPWGEEKIAKENLRVPHNFLPVKELEYTISSGLVEDTISSVFSQARFHYGLSRRITIGGGVEYLSSNSKEKYLPFINSSIRIASNIFFTQEYTHRVKYKGTLSYNLPHSLKFNLNYTKFNPTQEAILSNTVEEIRAIISKPFKMRNGTVFSRFTLNRQKFKATKNYNTELLLSGSVRGININLTTFANIIKNTDAENTENTNLNAHSNLSVSLRLLTSMIFKSQIRYDYDLGKLVSMQFSLEKHVFKRGSVNTSYEINVQKKISFFNVGFKYDFSFARFSSNANHTKKSTSFSQSVGGSLIYEAKAKYIDFNRNKNSGRGGIIFLPFLDINGNGKKDKNEPKVSGVNIRVNRGGIKRVRKDTTIVILGLEPYIKYYVELDANNFEYIAWKIKKKKLSIVINPNQLKLVEIPVSVVGEVGGMVYIKDENEQKGIGRIKVNFYNDDSVLVASTLTETDGYFNFLGFSPGSYTARIDSSQMKNLQMSAAPTSLSFDISPIREGDIVDNLVFVLRRK